MSIMEPESLSLCYMRLWMGNSPGGGLIPVGSGLTLAYPYLPCMFFQLFGFLSDRPSNGQLGEHAWQAGISLPEPMGSYHMKADT